MMGKRNGKTGSPNNGHDRLVYSEFGTPAADPDAPIVDRPPAEQTITVQASRKGRGGKTVTVASGFQHTPANLKALLKALKGQCGTGGTVKDGAIEIQGDLARKVAEALTATGYRVKVSGG